MLPVFQAAVPHIPVTSCQSFLSGNGTLLAPNTYTIPCLSCVFFFFSCLLPNPSHLFHFPVHSVNEMPTVSHYFVSSKMLCLLSPPSASAFGNLHCSRMKTQSTFRVAGYKKTFSTSSCTWVGSGIARHLKKPRSLPGRTLHASKRCLIWGPGGRARG